MIIDDCEYNVDEKINVISDLDIEDVNTIAYGLAAFCSQATQNMFSAESLIIRESDAGDAFKILVRREISKINNQIDILRDNTQEEMPVQSEVQQEVQQDLLWEQKLKKVHQKLVVSQKAVEANPTMRKRSKFEKFKLEQQRLLREKNFSSYLKYLTFVQGDIQMDMQHEVSSNKVENLENQRKIIHLQREKERWLAKASNIRYIKNQDIKEIVKIAISNHPHIVEGKKSPIIFSNTFSFLTYENKIALVTELVEISRKYQVVYLSSDHEVDEVSKVNNIAHISKNNPSVIDLTEKLVSSRRADA